MDGSEPVGQRVNLRRRAGEPSRDTARGSRFTFSTAVSGGKTSAFDTVYNALNNSISTFQAAAASLGSNVSLPCKLELSFTESYINTLQGGASKLTVADVNAESTNLVTLQTRQQLAIQSLSIATQSEQAVLRLFH